MSLVGNVGADGHPVRRGVSGAGLGAAKLSLGRRRWHPWPRPPACLSKVLFTSLRFQVWGGRGVNMDNRVAALPGGEWSLLFRGGGVCVLSRVRSHKCGLQAIPRIDQLKVTEPARPLPRIKHSRLKRGSFCLLRLNALVTRLSKGSAPLRPFLARRLFPSSLLPERPE